jgi:adiponectin receptor
MLSRAKSASSSEIAAESSSLLNADFDPEAQAVQHKEQFVLVEEAATPRFLKAPFILTGYRVHFSLRLCLRSLFHVHNETGNVWTHLLGAIAFVALMARSALDVRAVFAAVETGRALSFVDCAVLFSFYGCAAACLAFSSVYHLYGCHDEATHHFLYRFDLLGICLLVWGSYVSGLYVGFRCFPEFQLAYISLITVMVLASIVINNVPACQTRRFHAFRVLILVGLVAFSIVPTLHWVHITR